MGSASCSKSKSPSPTRKRISPHREIVKSVNQVDGNSLSVALSKRFSSLRASDK
jgi:hypothetical protein